MPSLEPRARHAWPLLGKELRELLASRAFWLLLLFIGPLVGHGFITAVESYSEASGAGGGPAALAQGLSPLDGILVPTFGAYDLAVTLLFPFVAIRLIAAEKSSGAWKLILQSPAGLGTLLGAKGVALAAGWLLAWFPGLLAIVLWKGYGGWLYGPELLNLLFGHLLRVAMASGVAIGAAAVADGAASAAIVTLGFTVGTWALDFVAEGRGGWLSKVAAYTPTAALRVFEQGQFRTSTAAITSLLGMAGFCVAWVWLRPSARTVSRIAATASVLLAFSVLMAGGAQIRAAWDLSENRRNSFSIADERALRQIRRPMQITVYLAPEDPRLADLDRGILRKLEHILPEVRIAYAADSRTGLFEGAKDRYGEVWYEMDGRRVMSRSTTEPIVLATIYQVAQVPAPVREDEAAYLGHPLAARPTGAALLYYVLWPVVVAAVAWLYLRR